MKKKITRLSTAIICGVPVNKKKFLTALFCITLTCYAINSNAQNTRLGTGALPGNSGTHNTAIGYFSINHNTTGSSNTATGSYSLTNNTTGIYNTASGHNSLYSNTTGTRNTASGWSTLYFNTTGSYNTASGLNSLHENTTGSYNTASGAYGLFWNTTGNYNTASGHSALVRNTTGSYNTANGAYSLQFNTTGNYNTASGGYSLQSNTSGYSNTANGHQSLFSNISGNSNTATGLNALYSNQYGSYNTASGLNSLMYNTGSYNTASGHQSLQSNTTGNSNTASGSYSLYSNTTGSYNTALGYSADVSTGNLTNATAIGYNAKATASNQVMLGNANVTSVRLISSSSSKYLEFLKSGSGAGQEDWMLEHSSGSLYVSSSSNDFISHCHIARFGTCSETFKFTVLGNALTSGGTWQTSDLKLKKNITEFNSALDIIKQLKPKTYFFKTDEYSKLNLSASKQYGFIAQELEKVLPELVQTSKQPAGDNATGEPQMEDLKAVNYTELIPILTKAVQELAKQNEDLQKQINELKAVKTSSLTDVSSSSSAKITVADASLEQNAPNPFRQTTTIGYTLPAKFNKAQIVVTDKNGKMLKQANISGTGKGNLHIDAATLSSGVYNYSLIVDGRVISSKQMLLTK